MNPFLGMIGKTRHSRTPATKARRSAVRSA
jgi:hypothetical protein